MVCDKTVCERWCAKDGVVKDGVYQTLHWGLLACLTRECHKHCQVSNVTKNQNITIEK